MIKDVILWTEIVSWVFPQIFPYEQYVTMRLRYPTKKEISYLGTLKINSRNLMSFPLIFERQNLKMVALTDIPWIQFVII